MRVLSCARRDPVHRLAFSADGRFLAANQGTLYHRGIEVFDFAELDAPTTVLELQGANCFFKFLPDRPILVFSLGSLFSFDLAAADPGPYRLVPEVLYPSAAFDVTADGQLVVVSRSTPYSTAGKAGYQAWKLRSEGAATRKWATNLSYGIDVIEDATVLVGHGAFAVAQRQYNSQRNEYDSLVFVYDARTGKKQQVLRHEPTTQIIQLAAHAPSDRLVAMCEEELVLWDTTVDDTQLKLRYLNHSFHQIAFHPSGNTLAAVNNSDCVLLVDIASFTVAKSFAWNVGPLHSVAFAADGTLGAAGSADGRIVVWDAEP